VRSNVHSKVDGGIIRGNILGQACRAGKDGRRPVTL